MPPFVPFGGGLHQAGPPNRLNADQQPGPFGGPRLLPMPRLMSAAERLQSLTFTNGLGKRLLSMIGIDMDGQNETTTNGAGQQQAPLQSAPIARALSNSSILHELNNRVGALMGGLSKMYNSTIQEQLNLLNERFRRETENNTNPWQQRVAQQVPMFFKQMADKVGEAQNQLNRALRNLAQVAQGNTTMLESAPAQAGAGAQPRPFFSFIDQFMHPDQPDGGAFFGPNENGDFFHQVSRSLGMQPHTNGTQTGHMGDRLRELWHTQVQPQIVMARNQMARVWRDLTASGALTPDSMARSRMLQANNNNNSNNNSSNLVDSLLKEASGELSEFSLITPKSDSSPASSPNAGDTNATPNDLVSRLSPQMQNRIVAMQRDLNHLWHGLSSSLQNAVNNVRNTLNPRPPFAPIDPMQQQQQQQQQADPAQNEINGKIQELSKLQQEANVVYDTVQKQQRDAQQRQNFMDRFRGFINNVDLSNINQWPDRIGERVNRFGAVINNFWNNIPERLDEMMAQRYNQENQARLRAQVNSRTSTTTTTPASASENSVMTGN
jgi:hypothetical protein